MPTYGKIKDPALKKAWLEDLESNRFRQCRNQLCTMTTHGGHASYCCLGVLGRTIQRTKKFDIKRPVAASMDLWTGMRGRAIFFDGQRSVEILPDNLRLKLGLTKAGQQRLTIMNDSGKSFKEIAQWIRKYL